MNKHEKDIDEMKCFRQINFTEDLAFFNAGGKDVDVWQLEGFLDGGVVEQAEVATRPLTAIRLCLKDKGKTPKILVRSIDFFNNAEPD